MVKMGLAALVLLLCGCSKTDAGSAEAEPRPSSGAAAGDTAAQAAAVDDVEADVSVAVAQAPEGVPANCFELTLALRFPPALQESVTSWAQSWFDARLAKLPPLARTFEGTCGDEFPGHAPYGECRTSNSLDDTPDGVQASTSVRNFFYGQHSMDVVQACDDNGGTWTDLLVDVTARDLYAAYEANEIAADDTYGGKTIRVTGKVRRARKSPSGEPVISLTGDGFLGSVDCYVREEHSGAAARLRKGKPATLVCSGAEPFLGDPRLRNCIVEP